MKKYDKLLFKYNKLLADNKQLKRALNGLRSKLTISEQYRNAIKIAFDLSLRLSQHLKTENELFKSAQQVSTLSDHIVRQTVTSSNDQMSDSVQHIHTNDSFDNNLCKSDLIVNQYEDQIKGWKEEMDLLMSLPINEVLITSSDQMIADRYLEDSSDQSDQEMDVDPSDSSKNMTTANSENELINTSRADPKFSENTTKLKCGTCGQSFSEESLLKEHSLDHESNDNQVKCPENNCNFKCDSKHELKEHLKIHRNETKTKIDEDLKQSSVESGHKITANWIPSSGKKRLYECKECNKQLSSMQSLRQHQRTVHNMISWFKCKFSGCEQKFEKRTDLRLHEELHRKQRSEINRQIQKIISTQNYPTLQFELNQNAAQANSESEVLSQYFSPTNGNSIESDINSTEISPISQQLVPKTIHLFKCQYSGCSAQYKQRSSLKKHEVKFHTNNSSSDVKSDDHNNDSNEQLDMSQRLELLELLYAEQQKQVAMA